MADDTEIIAISNALDANDRALTVHKAGHAAVAHGLGAELCFVEIELATGNGWSRSSVFDDNVKNLAVCVAGCRAEHAFGASSPRATKIGTLETCGKYCRTSPRPSAAQHAQKATGWRT